MAYEAMYTLRQLGFRIPEDIAITSNDDIQSDLIMPIKLTSACFSRRDMAMAAVDILCANIKNKNQDEVKHYTQRIIATGLTIGETT